MNVQDVMTKSPRTCRSSEPLTAAAKVLWDHDCGAVPVVDEAGRPVGIVTDRDCCMAAYTRGQRLQDVQIGAAMARTLFTVRQDEPVQNALQTMRQKQVRRLPVVDGQGRLCGIVSFADLCVRDSGQGERALVDALAEIVRPRNAIAQPKATTVVVPKAPTATPAPAATPEASKNKERSKKK